jgi:hypothetical protein
MEQRIAQLTRRSAAELGRLLAEHRDLVELNLADAETRLQCELVCVALAAREHELPRPPASKRWHIGRPIIGWHHPGGKRT